MGELDPLARTGEDHPMLADDVAAAQRREADIALPSWTNVTVARAYALVPKRHVPASRGGGTEHERRARRRVTLVAVVHLQDLDVELRAERLCHALGEKREQVDAKTHIPGLDDGRMTGRRLDLCLRSEERRVGKECRARWSSCH